MIAKNARVNIKTTEVAKITMEQAAYALGTTLSAFLIDSAMTRAREIIAQSQIINLNQKEAERFMNALEHPPEPTMKLKLLFEKHYHINHNNHCQ